jgi:hypothetical protein
VVCQVQADLREDLIGLEASLGFSCTKAAVVGLGRERQHTLQIPVALSVLGAPAFK